MKMGKKITGSDVAWKKYNYLRKKKISVANPNYFEDKASFRHGIPQGYTPKFRGDTYNGGSPGVVYFIREFISLKRNSQLNTKIPTKIGYCKFGATAQRFNDINRHHYKQLYLAYAQPVQDAVNFEFILHLRYKKDNINGEWFNLSEFQIRDAIKFMDTENVRHAEWNSSAINDWIFEGSKCLVSKQNMKYFWG